MKKNYILMYGDLTKNIKWFSDMSELENFSLHYAKLKHYKPTLLWKIIRKILKNIKIRNKSKFYEISNIKIKEDEEYYILMVSDTLLIYDENMINEINRNKNVHISLLLLNSMDASSESLIKVKDKFKLIDFDFILTFDYNDSIKYNFKYLGLTYYSKPKDIKQSDKKSDIYFVGRLKGNRTDTLLNAFENFEKNNVRCNFNIQLKNNEIYEEQKHFGKINYYKKFIPYEEVVAETVSSNCIFEVLQENQFGQSLRYFEAVCFNKKLLTNNPNIKELPFYNEKYMKIFNSVDDIDCEWVKKEETIDYKYNNEFSPIYLLDKIDELYQNK